MSYSQPAQPGRQVECKAIGTVSADRLAAVQLLLQGMAGLPGVSLLQHCMVLKGPSRDKSTPELRLLHQLATAPAALASSKDKLLQGDRSALEDVIGMFISQPQHDWHFNCNSCDSSFQWQCVYAT